MILNYAKYIFYTLSLTTALGACIIAQSALTDWKEGIIKATLDEVNTQQKDITIGQQDNVIKQHSAAFKKTQQIAKELAKIDNEISLATTVPEKVKVKYDIIEEMNCSITNFNDEYICIKS